ncbi:MAG TPA: MBL fold metallo-hydrolase [Smithellaceae bacterium]|nr:MBL fold metallo-hydrolase [Smithellaceae bacterium]
MKLCIHHGAKEIGGSCVEIEAASKRILLDLGLPLDAELNETPLPDVSGLENMDESLLGIAISHAHLDHYGLLAKVRQRVPVLIGEGALRIINAARQFFPNTPGFTRTIEIKNQTPIILGPFTITPYLMDHSAYDAYAFLVEAGRKKVFYSGDFRNHGRKGGLFEKLVQNPPKGVDVLLMEGTTLNRSGLENNYPSEDEIETSFVNHFKAAKGLTLIWTAGQNIDRIVSTYKACRKSGKKLIADLHTARILMAIQNRKLPQPGFRGFYVFVPNRQRNLIKQRELFDIPKSVSLCRIYQIELHAMASSSVMLFRPSMTKDLERADCLEGASLIYSLWPGYLKDERYQWFWDWLEKHQIPLTHCHTSGHAPASDLQRLAEAISANRLIPIHSFEPNTYKKLFKNVEIRNDGEIWSA